MVKSGYRVALKLLGADSLGGPSSSFVPEEKFWKCFWKIKASPKLVNFLWIIFHNAMASRENLFSRKCASSPLWPFCNLEVESIEHILFGLWKCGINATFQRGAGFTLFGWPLVLLQMCFVLLGKIASVCWSIWGARNSFLFEHLPVQPGHVAESTLPSGWLESFPLWSLSPSWRVRQFKSQLWCLFEGEFSCCCLCCERR